MEVGGWQGVCRVGKQKRLKKGITSLGKNPNKRVWCVLVKGLRLKAKTTVGTEMTRWVSDRSKRLMWPKRPVTDVLGCSNRERNYSRPKRPFCGSVCSAQTGTGKKKKKKKKQTPVNRVTQRPEIVV